ncbi:hypothetical protein [Flammeovirga agarivorans]|uniref:hypothetical protein n=1 Tax=Flammeovirga agarivorans TaxID=2726742 RepID=UPI001B3B20DC|nr:hypothetical protein [Flammeovirga agarivorans]
MLKQLIFIRFKQTQREIQSLGWWRSLLFLSIIVGSYYVLFLKTESSDFSLISSLVSSSLLVFLHFVRNDKEFLNTFSSSTFIFFLLEYLILSIPLIVLLIVHFHWLPLSIILLAILLVPLIKWKRSSKAINNKIIQLIPYDFYEWKSGVRKYFYPFLLLWLGIFFGSFQFAVVPIGLVVLWLVIFSFFEVNEPASFLIALELPPKEFLFLKVKRQVMMYNQLALPLIFVYYIFHYNEWFLPIVELSILMVLNIYIVILKYAFYHPNEKSAASQTLSSLGVLSIFIPFLIPALFILIIRFYFKAIDNLNFYLNDFDTTT